ncbi:MAG TPA: alpha/beta hydrolase [Actinomycetes bacterium]|jgi:pimeloyl-ACP methyl ester carboxylesterase|nr:alpha/beta hydrolase [Actinomycetes bacterium]
MASTQAEAGTAASQTVRSRDGTTISYRTVGQGPAVIVIPGAMSTADDYAALADALAESFTVHTMERRGRGLSGPQGNHYSIGKECEDVAALRDETRARYLVGHSYGGLVALEAARNNPALTRIAVYEPGVSVEGGISMTWVPRYRRRLAEGKELDAFAEFSIAAGPQRAQKMPLWMMRLLLLLMMRAERRQKLYQLLPANLLEHQEVARLDDTYHNYREVLPPTLLMFGGRSGLAWVAPAIERLTEVLPVSEPREFPKLDHLGPDQKGPREVAEAVKQYFLQ